VSGMGLYCTIVLAFYFYVCAENSMFIQVKVKFDPDHDFLPPGFGPTAVVSLHRALLQL
jgi:hypothetical protein